MRDAGAQERNTNLVHINKYGRHVCLACCAELRVNIRKCNSCTHCADIGYAALRTYSRGVPSTERKLPTLAKNSQNG